MTGAHYGMMSGAHVDAPALCVCVCVVDLRRSELGSVSIIMRNVQSDASFI